MWWSWSRLRVLVGDALGDERNLSECPFLALSLLVLPAMAYRSEQIQGPGSGCWEQEQELGGAHVVLCYSRPTGLANGHFDTACIAP